MDIITEIMGIIPQLKAGQIGAVGTALMLAVRLYRAIPGAPWPSEGKKWIAQIIIAAIGIGVSVPLAIFVGGMSIPAAIFSGLSMALTAVGEHKITQAIGSAVRTPQPAFAANPWRSPTSLLLPPPLAVIGQEIDNGRDAGKGVDQD